MCAKPAKVHVDGKDWCAIHNPRRVADRDAKQKARWKWEATVRAAEWAVTNASVAAAQALLATTEPLPDNLTAARKTLIGAKANLSALTSSEKTP